MRNKIQIAAMIAAYVMLTIGAAVCPAQTDDVITGGYSDASPSDENVVKAGNFAVAAQNKKQKNDPLKLDSILKAETQVVAGMNFRLCLALTSKETPQQASATVFLNLQNKFSLTNWTAGKCSAEEEDPIDETVTYKGGLEVGETDSLILYVGEETGDYAAFCFPNNTEVGRAILATCKNGEQCEFTGKVNYESGCKVKDLEADLSASGMIISVESVKLLTEKMEMPAINANAGLAPDVIVANLYAAEKAGASPFFQTKERALVDMYFEDDLADLIWNDAIKADGEVGALGFDPLYYAQDTKITGFAIGKPNYDKVSEITTVSVKFKNFGKAETIKYFFEQDQTGNWKILDIVYRNGESVKSLLFDAQLETEKMK